MYAGGRYRWTWRARIAVGVAAAVPVGLVLTGVVESMLDGGFGDPRGPVPGVVFDARHRVVVFMPGCGMELESALVQGYGTPDVLWQAEHPVTRSARSGVVALGDDSAFSVPQHPLRNGGLPTTFNVEFSFVDRRRQPARGEPRRRKVLAGLERGREVHQPLRRRVDQGVLRPEAGGLTCVG